MSLTFRTVNPASNQDVRALLAWANDLDTRYLWRWSPDEETALRKETLASVRAGLVGARPGLRTLMVLLDGRPIGDVTLELDPPHLRRKVKHTAWLGIVIGDAAARGRGYGRQAMAHLEDLARELGAKRAELGVFSFNEAAIRFYERLGYQPIGRTPLFTWWNGRLWDDISMEKAL